MLTSVEKEYLLRLARDEIIRMATKGQEKSIPDFSPIMSEKFGVFVTLQKSGELRGCIGYVEGVKPLQKAVREMAVSAAFEDPRFPSVQPEEIENLEIEISVLSPLHTIRNISEIEVGKHGLVIEKGFNKGLLLPQVAVEYGWDRKTFLRQTCYKAGLAENDWQKPGTVIRIFSAEIFSETK